MSHAIERDEYRGFDKGSCFELATAVTYTNVGVYPPGAIKPFTQRDKVAVIHELNAIVDSFRAVAPPGR
ncbi:MAG TPA: hypothetical protein VKX25_22095 [Bryobacteraceae bacterium]|jgi:hypothetical protein|nr:hypothetical protein [Bryobacteraceae bacterium]